MSPAELESIDCIPWTSELLSCLMALDCRARYRPRKHKRYDCAVKQVKRQMGQSVEDLAASADHEYGQMWEAWNRGVAHTVQPLGVYHSQPPQPPRGFGMCNPNAPPPPPAESFIVMRYETLVCASRSMQIAASVLQWLKQAATCGGH